MDLARLANIERSVVSRFPEFNSFEDLGYGSFLRFVTSHKELLEALEQVGGLARSGGMGTKLGHQVSLNSVLDFISQCGAQPSPVSQFYLLLETLNTMFYCHTNAKEITLMKASSRCRRPNNWLHEWGAVVYCLAPQRVVWFQSRLCSV